MHTHTVVFYARDLYHKHHRHHQVHRLNQENMKVLLHVFALLDINLHTKTHTFDWYTHMRMHNQPCVCIHKHVRWEQPFTAINTYQKTLIHPLSHLNRIQLRARLEKEQQLERETVHR